MKKQHLDPKAVRDFSCITEEVKADIKTWLCDSGKCRVCPFDSSLAESCTKTRSAVCIKLFPEIIGKISSFRGKLVCPCQVLYVKDVIKVAKEAIAWNIQKTTGNL